MVHRQSSIMPGRHKEAQEIETRDAREPTIKLSYLFLLYMQSVQTGGEVARQALRVETSEVEVVRLAELKKAKAEQEAAEKERVEAERAERLQNAADEAQALVDAKSTLEAEIEHLKGEVTRFEAEAQAREEARLEEVQPYSPLSCLSVPFGKFRGVN